MGQGLFQGLIGAFVGALLAAAFLWWWALELNWALVAAFAGVCFVLSLIWWDRFVDWLKEAFWWV